MYEQYYYAVLHELSLIPGYLLRVWYWWVIKVETYPELFIMIIGICLLILVVMRTLRHMKVIVHDGDEIHNLVRAMNKEK